MNGKILLVWALCVGGLCFGCLLLYDSLGESVGEMAELFADLGAFSQALGMDRVNIGTLEGYYAVEIAILFSLGGVMYAAMLGAGLVAKEEEGKTYEFLNALPLGRGRILGGKYGAFVALLAGFHMICICLILAGFWWMGSMPDMGSFVRYHSAAFFLCLETGTVCFLFSVLCRKKPMGAAVGLALLLYMLDLMARVVPSLEKVGQITPFSYSNAADIFSGATGEEWKYALGIGIAVLGVSLCTAFIVYRKKDLR